MPLSFGGTHAESKLPKAGNAGASPKPIKNLIAINPQAPPFTEDLFNHRTNVTLQSATRLYYKWGYGCEQSR